MNEQEMSRERLAALTRDREVLEAALKRIANHCDYYFGRDGELDSVSKLARQGLELRECVCSDVADELAKRNKELTTALSAANEKIEGLEQAIKITATELMDKMTEVEGGWSKIQSDLKLRVSFVNALREIVGRRMPKNKVGTPIVSDFDLIDAKMSERVEAIAIALQKDEVKTKTKV